MDNCVFCKIIKGDLPSYTIYEDEDSIAILDISPIKKGQVVVFPKVHTESNFSKSDYALLEKTLHAAYKTAAILEEKLGYDRSFIVIQGLGVNHLHIKIYPKYAEDKEQFRIYLPDVHESSEVLDEVFNTIKK